MEKLLATLPTEANNYNRFFHLNSPLICLKPFLIEFASGVPTNEGLPCNILISYVGIFVPRRSKQRGDEPTQQWVGPSDLCAQKARGFGP